MDVLSWSRHHRLFPGEGSFDLVEFVRLVLRAGYRGPLSLEVFNDTFRQTEVEATARHARRSLRYLEDAIARSGADLPEGLVDALPYPGATRGVDFVEIKADDTSQVEALLERAGFASRGRHRTKPVTLWTSGSARVVLNEQHARGLAPHVSALGLLVDDPSALSHRATELGVVRSYRRTYASEQRLDAAVAPDGTEIYWSAAGSAEPAWVSEFEHGKGIGGDQVCAVDHLSLTVDWQVVEDTALFHRALAGLRVITATDVPGPEGLVRSRVLSTEDRAVRLPLNVAPPASVERGAATAPGQHVAFACRDAAALAARMRDDGMAVLTMPQNYYDDLAARFDLTAERIEELRRLNLAYDRDGDGEYVHFYTRTIGSVFFEFVQRIAGYDGYGAGTAPVRLAAQSVLAPADSVLQ